MAATDDDLLIDLERIDADPSHPFHAAERRAVTAIMRRNGFSDADIAATLGMEVSEVEGHHPAGP